MDGLFALTAVAATDTEIFRENINSLTEKEQERLCRANQLGENQMTNNTPSDCGIKPCRKCGKKDVDMWDGRGTQAHLDCNNCGQGESVQVCDLFDYGDERRHADWIDDNYTNREDIIQVAKTYLIKEWNIRACEAEESLIRADEKRKVADWLDVITKDYRNANMSVSANAVEYAAEQLREKADIPQTDKGDSNQ